MNIVQFLEALVKLGIPVVLLSWWVYSSMYRNKLLDKTADHKATERAISDYRKSVKQSANPVKTQIFENKEIAQKTLDQDFWTAKWIRYGGGFYGLTALWTLIAFEISDIWQMISDPPRLIAILSGGVVEILIAFFKNQAMNFASAFSWVISWTGTFSLLWFLTAYVSYLLGMQLAKRWDIVVLYKRISESKPRL